MRTALLVVPILMMMGCVHPAPRFDRISVGMTKEQVRIAIGDPNSVSSQGSTEVWKYNGPDMMTGVEFDAFAVRFIDGKANAFGRIGDFDLGKDSTNRALIDRTDKVIIDKTDKITMESVTKFDLATELAKLDKLKKDGLITAEDYELLKKRAIEKAKE